MEQKDTFIDKLEILIQIIEEIIQIEIGKYM